MFSIRIHHGGTFQRYPGKRFIDGHVDIFDMVDINLFSVIALNRMVLQLGYTCDFEPLFYNYLRPRSTLDEGLYDLACEEDVRCLTTLVRSFKLLEVYIEHGYMAIKSYQRLPPQVRAITEDISEPGTNASHENRSDKMSLSQDDSSKPVKDSIFECQVIKDVMRQLSFEETKLDREAGFGDVAGSGIDNFGLSHDESFRVDDLDLNINVTVDLNVSQIETKVELYVFEVPMSKEADVGRTQEHDIEQVIVEVYIDSAYETQYHVDSSEDAGTDDDDDDAFLVDEENEIVEPDVDVHLFCNSIDVPFATLEEKKFASAKEPKDRVYLHSIESRRMLKLYKNDNIKVQWNNWLGDLTLDLRFNGFFSTV
ncbi:hypothetical protein Tco_0237575 [Tanacetum coccineum]